MSVRLRMIPLNITIVMFALAGAAMGSMQSNTPPGRLRIAILGFANETDNPEAAHWRCGIEDLVANELREINHLFSTLKG